MGMVGDEDGGDDVDDEDDEDDEIFEDPAFFLTGNSSFLSPCSPPTLVSFLPPLLPHPLLLLPSQKWKK